MNSYLKAADHLPLRFNSAEWFVGRHVREGRAQSVAIIDDQGSMRRDERIAFIAPDSQWLSTRPTTPSHTADSA